MNTLFFALDRFEGHDVEPKELRESYNMSLGFVIYSIIGVVDFVTKLIATVVKALARCCLEY